jgi:hypothetical protein
LASVLDLSTFAATRNLLTIAESTTAAADAVYPESSGDGHHYAEMITKGHGIGRFGQ